MFKICYVFLCCILGLGVEVKFVLGVKLNNFGAISGEIELLTLDHPVTAGILLSIIEKLDVMLVLLRELLKRSLFK